MYIEESEISVININQVDVCGGSLDDDNVTLIGGETYDPVSKTVQSRPGFVTLACAGEAVAKMKMFNFGPNDLVNGQRAATWQERQATLKMLTADYCGTTGKRPWVRLGPPGPSTGHSLRPVWSRYSTEVA